MGVFVCVCMKKASERWHLVSDLQTPERRAYDHRRGGKLGHQQDGRHVSGGHHNESQSSYRWGMLVNITGWKKLILEGMFSTSCIHADSLWLQIKYTALFFNLNNTFLALTVVKKKKKSMFSKFLVFSLTLQISDFLCY